MKKVILLIFFSTLILFCYSQDKTEVWDYPIKPGSNAWGSLSSSQEMINACQIPTYVLSNISTARLADLCLNYPLLGDILLANNYQEGFDKLSEIFNGFQELLS